MKLVHRFQSVPLDISQFPESVADKWRTTGFSFHMSLHVSRSCKNLAAFTTGDVVSEISQQGKAHGVG